MRTDDLVASLARDLSPVDATATRRRMVLAMLAGVAGAVALMGSTLGFEPAAAGTRFVPLFWMKIGFVAAVVAASVPVFRRAGTPGAPTAAAAAAVVAPFVVVWLAAAFVLARAAPDDRVALVLGETWRECPYYIALLSVPAFAAAFWAMKGLAPTRLRFAGAIAGLLSAGIGALVYAFHCPEIAPPFVGVWYVLGMLVPMAAGALIGPRVLRW